MKLDGANWYEVIYVPILLQIVTICNIPIESTGFPRGFINISLSLLDELVL